MPDISDIYNEYCAPARCLQKAHMFFCTFMSCSYLRPCQFRITGTKRVSRGPKSPSSTGTSSTAWHEQSGIGPYLYVRKHPGSVKNLAQSGQLTCPTCRNAPDPAVSLSRMQAANSPSRLRWQLNFDDSEKQWKTLNHFQINSNKIDIYRYLHTQKSSCFAPRHESLFF